MPQLSIDEFFKRNDPLKTPEARNTSRQPDGSVRVPIEAFFNPTQRKEEPEPNAFKRGLLTVGSDFTAATGLVADVFGYDEAAQGFYNRAQEIAQERDAIPRKVGRVEDIQGVADVGVFALETLLENAPLLASIAIPGLTAAKVAGFGGRTALARAAEQGASAAARKAAQISTRKRVTGTFAAFLSDVGLQTGESVQIALDAGADPADVRVVGAGLGKGALDFVPILALARKLGIFKKLPIAETLEKNLAGELVERGFVRRAAGNVGTLIAYEVPTEVSQEVINIALDRSLAQFEGQLTPEEKSQLLNAAGGAAAFGLLGIPAAVVRPSPGFRPATDEELHAADEAATPEPLALSAPPAPTPEEEVSEAPFIVQDAPYDPSLDTPRSGTSVAQGVAQALGREQRRDQPGTFVVTEDGVVIPHTPDPHTQFANVLRNIPEFQRTPTEQAVVEIDDVREAAIQRDTHELVSNRELEPHYPTTIQTLLQARDDTHLEPGFRRTTDGQLNQAGKKRIAQIDKAIAKITERLGLPNPLEQTRTFSPENMETGVQQVNAQEAARREERPDIKLSPAESALLEKLETKDFEEGLTPKEEETRERLLAKREGVEVAERQALTPEEVQDLRSLGAQIGDTESMQVRLRTDRKTHEDILAEIRILQADVERLRRAEEPEDANLAFAFEMDGDMTLADGISSAQERIQVLREELRAFGSETASFTEKLVDKTQTKIEKLQRDVADLQRAQQAVPERRGVIDPRITRLNKEIAAERARLQRLQDSLRRREASGERQGMSIQDATRVVEQMTRNIVNGPEYVIANSGDPRAFTNQPQKRKDISGNAKGVFFLDEPNKVYVFADKHANAEDLAKTVFHETLAHFGLRAYFTEEELSNVLRQVYNSRGVEIQERFGVPTSFQEARTFAEEFIAETAESGIQQDWFSRVIAALRRVFRKIRPSLKMTDNDIRFMLRDVSKFLTGRIPSRNPRGVTTYMSSEAFLRAAGRGNVESTLPEIDSFRSVWGAKMAGWVLTPLQMAEKFNIPGAKEYIEQVQQWEARRGELTKPAADIADTWMKLPKRESQRLAKIVFEISERSDEIGRRLTPQEVAAIFRDNNGSKTLFEMYTQIDESFRSTLDQLQSGLERSAIRSAVREHANPRAEAERLHTLWTKDKTREGRQAFFSEIARSEALQNFHLGDRLIRIENELDILRTRNYFPRMRFGKYAVVIRAQEDLNFQGQSFKGPRDGKQGEVVSYETFETFAARASRLQELQRQFPANKYRVQQSLVTDEEFSFLGMPPALFEELNKVLNLSEGQTETLKELYFKFSPGRAFLRHLTRRKGISGYSIDAMRVYASYMMNAANHIARVEFHEEMGAQLNTMREASKRAREGTRFGVVQEYFTKHFKYIMNPEQDLAQFRAMGFLWYLGFNVKSAFVNLTQVPMVAYPFLAQQYGDAAATAAIARAYKSVSQKMLGRSVFDTQTDEDLSRGIRERFLDESFATELAGIGESDVLQRLMPEEARIRLLNKTSYYGAFLFKHAEKYNREVVFIAARELALKNRPGDREGAFRDARKAVQATMFEYSKWNRPAFMRGKKSVFFLFWQYMQHLSFMAFGGEGKGAATRTWLMLLFAAGIQGLPFAENLFDLIDFGATEIKEALGVPDPKVALRDDIRELASTLTDTPDMIMHGLSRYYGLGPVHLMRLMGAPVPNTDISGSLSAGRILPGTREAFGAERDPNAKFGRTMVELLGPVIGMGYAFWKAMESDDPDTWKVWERALPTALQGASKAARRNARGEETFRGGGTVREFDPQNAEQRAENIAQAFGFATTRVNQRFELRASQESLKQYWVTRRSMVMENFAFALMSEDQEGIADARKALAKFNREAPAPGLKISAETLKKSIRERFRRGHLREIGVPNESMFRPLYKRLEEANPEGAPAQ